MKNNNNNYNYNNYSNDNDNDKFYILACFARSLDQFHVKNNMIHLLGSIFYTKSITFDLLKRYATNYKYSATIIRLSPVANLNFNVIEHSEYLVEVQFSIFYFLELYKGGGQSFDNFLEGFFSSESLAEQNKNPSFKYSKVLFVFEDLNWFTLQLLFQMRGIKLSGGNISKRQILSSAELSLSFFLLMLGFNDIDVYNSYKYLANLSKSEVMPDESSLTIDIERQSLYYLMKAGLSKDKDSLSITIANLEKDILNKRRNLESLELSLSSKKNEILRAKKLLSNSKSIINLNKNIELIKKFIDNKENELLLLNSKLSDITKEIDNLTEIPYTELKAKYFKNYHNLKKYNDVTMLKKQLSKATNISRSLVNRKAGSAPVSRTGCRGLYTQSSQGSGLLDKRSRLEGYEGGLAFGKTLGTLSKLDYLKVIGNNLISVVALAVIVSLYGILNVMLSHLKNKHGFKLIFFSSGKEKNTISAMALVALFKKFKGPNWLKYLIMFVLCLILLIIFYLYSPIILYYYLSINLFWIKVIGSLGCSFVIFYNLLSLHFLLKFSVTDDKDLVFPQFLPSIIRNYLLDLKRISKYEYNILNIFINIYVRGIFFHFVILLLFLAYINYIC